MAHVSSNASVDASSGTSVDASCSDRAVLETGDRLTPRYNEQGLIPVCTTDAETGRVLMQAFMNEESLRRTLKTGQVHYFSRSRREIWHKGATSGQVQHVQALYIDCDQDSLWVSVVQDGGGCCHVGHKSCFYRQVDLDGDQGRLRLVAAFRG